MQSVVHGIIKPFAQNQMVKASNIILKQNARTAINLCVLSVRMEKSMYLCLMIQVVVVEDQYQIPNIRKNFSNLVRQ